RQRLRARLHGRAAPLVELSGPAGATVAVLRRVAEPPRAGVVLRGVRHRRSRAGAVHRPAADVTHAHAHPPERDAESRRLADDAARTHNWKRWGPYLSERQWGTVREDYSEHGTAWDYFPHDHARSRAYRWGEDGLLGITDRECRLCFAVALWNERDPILKERLFGLTGSEGNHGEDVKES